MNTLKDFRKNVKGASLKFKLKRFRWALIYAWQRAWRGYDDTDVFALDENFLEKIHSILLQFRKNNVCLFVDPDASEKNTTNIDEVTYTEEQTDAIIDKMIYLLENIDYDAYPDEWKSPRDWNKIVEYQKQVKKNQDDFFRIFVRYFDQLWY